MEAYKWAMSSLDHFLFSPPAWPEFQTDGVQRWGGCGERGSLDEEKSTRHFGEWVSDNSCGCLQSVTQSAIFRDLPSRNDDMSALNICVGRFVVRIGNKFNVHQ